MISVPEAGLLPMRAPPDLPLELRDQLGGNPCGYTGNAWSSQMPAISQWPVVVSLPGETVAPLP